MGWEYGSDTYELKYSFNYLKAKSSFINLNFGIIEIGDESIIERPYNKYLDYSGGKFPSGDTAKQFFFCGRFDFYYKKNISIYLNFNSFDLKLPVNDSNIEVGLDFYILKTNNNIISST